MHLLSCYNFHSLSDIGFKLGPTSRSGRQLWVVSLVFRDKFNNFFRWWRHKRRGHVVWAEPRCRRPGGGRRRVQAGAEGPVAQIPCAWHRNDYHQIRTVSRRTCCGILISETRNKVSISEKRSASKNTMQI